MAKTESTAVNDLIKLATTQTPLRQDSSEDLMFAPPSKKDRRSTRQHALVPHGSDVPPLPRNRAPQSTQQNAIAMPALKIPIAAADRPSAPADRRGAPGDRRTGAAERPNGAADRRSASGSVPPPLPRTATIPPLPGAPSPTGRASSPTARGSLPNALAASPTARGSLPNALAASPTALAAAPEHLDASFEPVATRVTRPSLPPPMRASVPAPARMPMPSEYPVVSAVHSQPLAPVQRPAIEGNEALCGDDGLDVDVESLHGDTAQLAKPRTSLQWMIKLAPLAGAMILLGVFVGGFLVFGQDDKQRSAARDETDAVAVAAAAGASAAPTGEAPAPAGESAAIIAAAADNAPQNAAITPPNLAATAEPAAITPPNLAATTATATARSQTATAPTATTATAPTATTTSAPTASATTTTATAVATTAPPITSAATTRITTRAGLAARPVFVDVRIDSKPSGATVMLLDRGKQTFLGTTPISTAVDPSRAYDIVFSHPRRPTQSQPLDPRTTTRLAVVLSRSGNPRATTELVKPTTPSAAKAQLAATAKPVTVKATSAKAARVGKVGKPAKIIEPVWDAPTQKADTVEPTEPAETATPDTAPRAEKAVGGDGTLMISSKPPCEIHVDGRPTGLMTPQRAISLPAGKHRITLINPSLKIKKAIAVEITANESTKVIQDLTALMK